MGSACRRGTSMARKPLIASTIVAPLAGGSGSSRGVIVTRWVTGACGMSLGSTIRGVSGGCAPRSRKNASILSRWCSGIGRAPPRHFLICTGDIPSASPSISELEWVRAISDFNSRGVTPLMWVRGSAGTHCSGVILLIGRPLGTRLDVVHAAVLVQWRHSKRHGSSLVYPHHADSGGRGVQ